MIALLLLACVKPAPEGLVEAAVEVPDAVLPHCLWGLDPHARGVAASEPGRDGGYRLSALDDTNALRYAGLESGDLVRTVNGYPLGTQEAWYAARRATLRAERCVWTVERDGQTIAVAATIVPWPEPEAAQVQPDGTVRVSRAALARALTDPYRRFGRSYDHLHRGEGVLVTRPHLRDALEAAGLPDSRITTSPAPAMLRQSDVEAALIGLLSSDSLTLTVGDPPRDIKLVATGPTLGPPPPVPERPAAAATDVVAPTDTSWIRAVGDGRVLVARDGGERWFAGGEGLAREGRMIPHRNAEGERDGMRVSAIRRHSVFDAIGLKNGDVVHSVGGHPLADMTQAMEAWEALRGTSSFTIELTRRGLPVRLEIEVVEQLPADDP